MTTTTSSHAQDARWLNTAGRPTAAVLLIAAAILAVLTAAALIELFTAPLPPVQYGPFGGPHLLTGVIALLVIFLGLGVWAARGLQTKTLALMLLVLMLFGPVGWVLGLLDSLGPGVVNSVSSAGGFVAMFLLVVAPLTTVVGVAAAIAEAVRVVFASRSNLAPPISAGSHLVGSGPLRYDATATEKT